MINQESSWRAVFRKMPFARLVESDAELAEMRREHATFSQKKRHMAAQWMYDAAMSDELFGQALAAVGQSPSEERRWPAGVEALAVDPLHAPAMLSVGSIEYQVGRCEEAMNYFLALTTLPEDTEDLSVIIDKAGDFLCDADDIDNASVLYSSAAQAFPRVALYLNALGYCAAKQGHRQQAVDYQRRAVALEPENCKFLSDLGWSLVEAKMYDEAQSLLAKAVALSPPDCELARGNLEELERRQNRLRRPNRSR